MKACLALLVILATSLPLYAAEPWTKTEVYDFLCKAVPGYKGAEDFFKEVSADRQRREELNKIISEAPELRAYAEEGLAHRKAHFEIIEKHFSGAAQKILAGPWAAASDSLARFDIRIQKKQEAPLSIWEIEQLAMSETASRFRLSPSLTPPQLAAQRMRDINSQNAYQFFERRKFAYAEMLTKPKNVPTDVDVELWRQAYIHQLREARLENLNSMLALASEEFGEDAKLKVTLVRGERLNPTFKIPLQALLVSSKRLVDLIDSQTVFREQALLKTTFTRQMTNSARVVPAGFGVIARTLGLMILDSKGLSQEAYYKFMTGASTLGELLLRAQDLLPYIEDDAIRAELGRRSDLYVSVSQKEILDMIRALNQLQNFKLSAGRTNAQSYVVDALDREARLEGAEYSLRGMRFTNLKDAQKELQPKVSNEQSFSAPFRQLETGRTDATDLAVGLKWWGYRFTPTYWQVRDSVAESLGRVSYRERERTEQSRTFGIKEGYAQIGGTLRKMGSWKQTAAGLAALAAAAMIVPTVAYQALNGAEMGAHAAGNVLSDQLAKLMSSSDPAPSQVSSPKSQAPPPPESKGSSGGKSPSNVPDWDEKPRIHDTRNQGANNVAPFKIYLNYYQSENSLPQIYHVPYQRDYVDDDWKAVAESKDPKGGNSSINIYTPMAADIVNGYVSLPVPSGYEAVTAAIMNYRMGSRPVYGRDFVIEKAEHRPLYRLKVLNSDMIAYGKVSIDFRVDMIKEHVQANLPSLDLDAVRATNRELADAGFEKTAEAITRRVRDAESLGKSFTPKDIQDAFVQTLYYPDAPLAIEPNRALPANHPFADFHEFTMDGNGFAQCTGANLLYARFMERQLARDKRYQSQFNKKDGIGVLNIISMVRKDDTNAIDFNPGHVTTVITRRNQSGWYIHLDPTPFNKADELLKNKKNKPFERPPARLAILTSAQPRVSGTTWKELDAKDINPWIHEMVARAKGFAEEARAEIRRITNEKTIEKDVLEAMPLTRALRVASKLIEWQEGRMTEEEFKAFVKQAFPRSKTINAIRSPNDYKGLFLELNQLEDEYQKRATELVQDKKEARFTPVTESPMNGKVKAFYTSIAYQRFDREVFDTVGLCKVSLTAREAAK